MVSTSVLRSTVKSTKKSRLFRVAFFTSDESAYFFIPLAAYDQDEYRFCCQLERFTGKSAERYSLAQFHTGEWSCDCQGFERHQSCKHTLMLSKLQQILLPQSIALKVIR
jgi:hypothetical protein